jgi:hypothetical protein
LDFITLQTTSFAKRQPGPAFQVLETIIFAPDLCKASLAAIRFIRLATKTAPKISKLQSLHKISGLS